MYLPVSCPDQMPGTGAAYQGEAYGLGCVACAGTCEGLGLFDSGTDVSGWGALEWGAVGLGLFAAFSMFSTTRRATRAVGEGVRRTRRRVGKRIAGR